MACGGPGTHIHRHIAVYYLALGYYYRRCRRRGLSRWSLRGRFTAASRRRLCRIVRRYIRRCRRLLRGRRGFHNLRLVRRYICRIDIALAVARIYFIPFSLLFNQLHAGSVCQHSQHRAVRSGLCTHIHRAQHILRGHGSVVLGRILRLLFVRVGNNI